MSTLAEIEAAADALPASQKQELFLFLVTRLRADGIQLPDPRDLSLQQINKWIAEDQIDLQRLRDRR